MLQDHHNPTVEVPLATLVALMSGEAASVALASEPEAVVLAQQLDAARAWLTPGIASIQPSRGIVRQFVLEVLSLKLRAVSSLCDLLRHSGQPTLATEQVRGQLGCLPGSLMPARWSMRVHLQTEARGDETLASGPVTPPEKDLRRTLGLILAQCMLSNDERSPAAAAQLARDLAVKLTDSVAACDGSTSNTDDLSQRARTIFANHGARESHCVLHSAERRADAPPALAESLWHAIGELMLRLLTNIAGFSLPPNPLIELQSQLGNLSHRADIAAFGAEARRQELHALLMARRSKITP